MDNNGTSVSAADFLRTYGNQDAIRWALMLTEYGQLSLQLQGLPGAAATLNSKPAFKRLVKTLLVILHKHITLKCFM